MRHAFSSIQWAFFILANIVVIPVSIGFAFGLPLEDIATLLQRTFFVVGITSLLQGLFGHKLPLNESPAGLWWSLFLIYAGASAGSISETNMTLRSLELGILIAGGLFIVLSALQLMNPIKKLFTPLVTGTYMILLVSQLAGPFVRGILGIDYLQTGVDPKVAVAAIVILIFSVILAKSRFKFLSSYSILISLAFGWILFELLGITKPLEVGQTTWFSIAKPFAWGMPMFDIGIVLTSIFTSFLLLTNLVASIDIVAKVTESKETINYNRAGFFQGINHLIAGSFSVIGSVPIAGVAGFIQTTQIKERLPYLIGSALILLLSFFPIIMTFLASLPVPVGYATLFLSISGLAGIGINNLRPALGDLHAPSIVSLSLMAGFGLNMLPAELFDSLPGAISSVLNNGLIIGVLICIFMEQLLTKKQHEQLS